MKKNSKKFLVSLVTMTMILILSFSSMSYILNEENLPEKTAASTYFSLPAELNEAEKKQQELNDTIEKISNIVEEETVLAPQVFSPISKVYSKKVYPEYYGGTFIEGGKIIVGIKQEKISQRNSLAIGNYLGDKESGLLEIEKIASKDDDVAFRYVNNSVNELNEMMDYMINYMGAEYDIASVSRDDQNSVVKIGVYQINDQKIAKIQLEISNSNLLVFKNEDALDFTPEVMLYPRSKVTLDGMRGTFGYAAYRYANGNTYVGFITTGHFTGMRIGAIIESAGFYVVGMVDAFQRSGAVDASFVDLLDESVSAYNGAYSGSTGVTLNSTVYLHSTNSGDRYGTVTDINYSIIMGGVRHDRMARASYSSEGGDSGGTITSGSRIVGIHVGTGGVFSKATEINSALNTSTN